MLSRTDIYAKVSRRALGYAQRFASEYADAQRNSLVIITRPYTYSASDASFGRYEPAEVIYDDQDTPGVGAPAGISPTSGPMVVDFSSEPASYESITVYLPEKLPKAPLIDDLLTVMVTPDTAMVGRVYRITGIAAGGRLTSSTTLTCTGLAPSKEDSWRT